MYRTLDMAQWLAVELQSLILAGYQNLIYHSSPKKPRNALKNVTLQKEFISWEVWRYTQYPSSEEYNTVCKLLIQKYPVLKDTIGNGFVSDTFYNNFYVYNILQGSWKVQLRQKLKNMRRPDDSGHKRARTESNESTEILDEGTSLPSAKRKHLLTMN